jgi:matrixin/putative peptidoglycan binding protein
MTAHDSRGRVRIEDVPTQQQGARSPELIPVQDYLERFGYLARDKFKRGDLDGDTARGLAEFQERLGLKVTRDFDQLTRAAMSLDRCGMPDLVDGIDATTVCPWADDPLVYVIHDPRKEVQGGVSGDDAAEAVRKAFSTWAQVVPIGIRETMTRAEANVEVRWQPAADPDHDMVGGIVAHADWPGKCWVVVDGLPKPLHFDVTEHAWAVEETLAAYDIETVALHEIGHLLGLRHSTVRGSVMFPTANSGSTRRELQEDDLAAIKDVYANPRRPGSHRDR